MWFLNNLGENNPGFRGMVVKWRISEVKAHEMWNYAISNSWAGCLSWLLNCRVHTKWLSDFLGFDVFHQLGVSGYLCSGYCGCITITSPQSTTPKHSGTKQPCIRLTDSVGRECDQGRGILWSRDKRMAGLSLLHSIWGLSWKPWRLQVRIFWRFVRSHVWWWMLAVGWGHQPLPMWHLDWFGLRRCTVAGFWKWALGGLEVEERWKAMQAVDGGFNLFVI